MSEMRTLSIVYTSDTGIAIDAVDVLDVISELFKKHNVQLEAISDHKIQLATDFPQGLTTDD